MSTKYFDIMPLTRKAEFDFLMAMRKPQTKIHVVDANEPVLSLSRLDNVISAMHRIQGILEPLNALPDDTTCEWNEGGQCEPQDYPEMCASCIESFMGGKQQMEEDRYREV